MKKLIALPLSLALALSPLTVMAETVSTDENVRVPEISEIFTDLPHDLKDFGNDLVDRDHWPLTVGALGATAMMVVTDYETWQAARIFDAQSPAVRQFSNMGVSIGDGFFQFGLVAGFAAVGKATGNKRLLRTASQVTEAILATGIGVQVIKHVSGRESPFSSETRTGVWRMFPNQIEYHKDFQKFDAVPSGHLSTAITTFIVIRENYPDQRWISFVGWPVIGWVGYGLAATSIHWWSDYPIAVALGYSFARIITRENRTPNVRELPKSQEIGWRPVLLPGYSSEGAPILVANWAF